MSNLVGRQIRIAAALVAGSAIIFVVGALTRIKLLMLAGAILMIASPYLAVYVALRRSRPR